MYCSRCSDHDNMWFNGRHSPTDATLHFTKECCLCTDCRSQTCRCTLLPSSICITSIFIIYWLNILWKVLDISILRWSIKGGTLMSAEVIIMCVELLWVDLLARGISTHPTKNTPKTVGCGPWTKYVIHLNSVIPKWNSQWDWILE